MPRVLSVLLTSQKVCCLGGLLDQNIREINEMFMCFYLFHFCPTSVDKFRVFFFLIPKKTATNSRCDEDQSMMCEAAASSRQACQNILHEQIWIHSISYFTTCSYWCWCQTVMITFVSFVNVQNEIDIRSDTSHNHSCAFVVFFKKTKLLYKGKHAQTPEHNIRKK